MRNINLQNVGRRSIIQMIDEPKVFTHTHVNTDVWLSQAATQFLFEIQKKKKLRKKTNTMKNKLKNCVI